MAQTIQRSYNCSNMNQLIDLNGQYTNFRVKFDLRSVNGEPFKAVIADQSILDSGDDMSFREAPTGELLGEMVADNNVYQNYFLVLKSDTPVEVNVHISFEPLPDFIKKENFQQKVEPPTESVLSVRNVCITVLVIGGAMLIYREWKKRYPPLIDGGSSKSILTSMEEIAKAPVE